MKACLLAALALSMMWCRTAHALNAPCGMALPDFMVDLNDNTIRRGLVIDTKAYLKSAAGITAGPGGQACSEEVRVATDRLASKSLVKALQLSTEELRQLRDVLQLIRDNAANRREEAIQARSAQVQQQRPDDDPSVIAQRDAVVQSNVKAAAEAAAQEDSAGEAKSAMDSEIGKGARYNIYAGPAYSLKPDGSWSNGVDTVFRSETPIEDPLRAYFQLSYTTRNGPKAEDGKADGGAAPAPGNTDLEFVSPFSAKGGIVNIQTGANWMASRTYDWIGLSLRGGYESLPTEKDGEGLNTFKPFGSVGLVTRTLYTEQQSLGQLFLGYSHDRRWDKDLTGDSKNRYDRLVFSGLLELFQVSKATIATRLYASMPVTGKGDTEFRISVLIGFKLQDIAHTLGTP
jgi:hypothetical protein